MTDRPDELSRYEPIPQQTDVEAVLGRHTAKRAVFVLPVMALVFGLFRGWEGAVAAAVGVVIVAANFWLSGVVLSRSARISLGLYHAAALFGFFLRLGLIMVAMFAVAQVFEIDRVALGISAVVSYLALLSWEALAVAKGAERELEWT
ncbi:MAG TPA: ATP synthase subunit I [Acidimicrobiia bacterium]|nr:ATP synthase subunit I [Acidimicrobiia bacterium]